SAEGIGEAVDRLCKTAFDLAARSEYFVRGGNIRQLEQVAVRSCVCTDLYSARRHLGGLLPGKHGSRAQTCRWWRPVVPALHVLRDEKHGCREAIALQDRPGRLVDVGVSIVKRQHETAQRPASRARAVGDSLTQRNATNADFSEAGQVRSERCGC